MTDPSKRRRKPKGMSTGGRFAKGNGGGSDASDLDQNDDQFEMNGLANLPDEAKAEAFGRLIENGETDFNDADLHGLDLTGYDLKGLNLDGANLTESTCPTRRSKTRSSMAQA